jgi:DNA primase
LDNLLASGMAIRVAIVPAPHDPDSFINANGGEAFKALVGRAEGFFDFYLNRVCSANDVATDRGRLAVLRDMAEAVHKTGNLVLVDKYAQKTALRLGVAPDAVRVEFNKRRGSKPAAAQPAEESVAMPDAIPQPTAIEDGLLKLVLQHDELIEWVAAHLDPKWLRNPQARCIVEMRLEAHRNLSWRGAAAFLADCQTQELQSMVAGALLQERPLPNPDQQLADVTKRLRDLGLDREIATLMQRATLPDLPDAERMALLSQQQTLRAAKSQPLASLG